MKRKIFSKLLMVALVIAAVGSFVSCKDYDDDINNLQKQIDAKAAISELTALQSTLDSKIAAAQSAATAAQAKADAAATKTSVDELKKALETAIADAKKAGTDAGTKAGEAITAANKAQETADAAAAAAKKADEDAKAALADALKTIEETYQTKADAEKAVAGLNEAIAAVKETADAAFTKAEAEKLQEQVDGLKAELEAAIDEKIDAKIQEVNNAVASVDAIWSAVTSVELWASNTYAAPGQRHWLYLLTGEEVDNDFGGAAGSKASKLQVLYQDGHALEGEIASPIAYKAGDEISFDNRIIIRVNPANAVVSKEDIVLINSLGDKTLNELVEVKDVKNYDKLITTRAGVATGLKVVTFARKANVTDAALAAATSGDEIEAPAVQEDGDALFAIGINNTKSASEERFAYSTFDLAVRYGAYIPEKDLNFLVQGDKDDDAKIITALKNRYTGGKLVGEDQTRETPAAPYADGWYPEFTWNGANDAAIKAMVPAVDTLWVNADGTKKNFLTTEDARGNLTAKVNYVITSDTKREFTIYAKHAANANVLNNKWNNIQYYYVTLDKCAAVESAPSEYQAWKKYEYEGLYTITPATDNLTIKIKSEAAVGDIIGFRVWAVNYDGTLVDPDGRSFYVQVGEPAAEIGTKFTVDVTANKADKALVGNYATIYADLDNATQSYNSGIIPFTLPENFLTTATFTETGTAGKDFEITTIGQDKKVKAAVSGKYYLLKDEKGKEKATSWSNLKYIAVEIKEIQNILDDATVATSIKFSGKDNDHHGKEVNIVTVDIKKLLPKGPKNFSWKTGAPITGNTLNLFMTPSATIGGPATWNASAKFGWVDMSTYCNNLNNNYRFRFADANVLADGAYKALDESTDSKSKVVFVRKVKTGNANDGDNFLLGLQGPASLLGATDPDTYVNGTKTSGLKVQYTYDSNISLTRKADDSDFNAATAPTVDIPTTVTQAKFTYAYADNTYRTVKYESAKTWTAASGTPTTYYAGTWNAASDKYVLLYDQSDLNGIALQPAVTATTLPSDNKAGNDPAAYRWNAEDAAIVAPGNTWTAQATYETSGDRKAIIPAAGNAIGAYAAGYASIINLTKFVIVNNSQYDASNNIPFATGMFVAAPTITFKSDVNQVNNEYYTADLNWGVGVLRFAVTAPAPAIPTVDVAATVVLTGKDAFGQDQVITLPFTIVK